MKPMKTIIFSVAALFLLMLPLEAVHAQNDKEEKAVLGVVQTLFDAMAEADSAKAASAFVEGGHIYRVDAEDNTSLSSTSGFVAGIANFEQKIVERMWDPEVLVDDNIAMAWTPYDLHVDGNFSHCGTNLISLIKTGDGWKITDITYNVRQEECKESPLGPVEQ